MAQDKILSCYSAARDAEAAGANITTLTGTLTQAGSLLDKADLAYYKNDFDTALSYAQQSQSELDNFLSRAEDLRSAAAQQRSVDFWINMVGSIVGAFAVIGVGVALWMWTARKNKKTGEQSSGSSKV